MKDRCWGKRRFADRLTAEKVLFGLLAHGAHADEIGIYRCETCQQFHLGRGWRRTTPQTAAEKSEGNHGID